MVNYKQGKIYIINNTINDIAYIGSTAQFYLTGRMKDHRKEGSIGTKSTLHRAMKEIGVHNFQISLLLDFPCETKDQLCAEEYRLTNLALSNGQLLYNEQLNGKHSAKSIERMRLNNKRAMLGVKLSAERKLEMSIVQRGEKNSQFAHGCISYDKSEGTGRWKFKWNVDGKTHTKSFALTKWGSREAKRMAQAVRQALYPEYIQDDESICIEDLMGIEL
jgi:group I intron endonuclease